MRGRLTRMPRPWRSLSARLLVLTIGFVMLAEVFVYAPSIASFRYNYLQNRLADAHIAVLALLATPDNMVGEQLTAELLDYSGAYVVGLERVDGSKLILQGEFVLVGMNVPDERDPAQEAADTTIMANATVRVGEYELFSLIRDA